MTEFEQLQALVKEQAAQLEKLRLQVGQAAAAPVAQPGKWSELIDATGAEFGVDTVRQAAATVLTGPTEAKQAELFADFQKQFPALAAAAVANSNYRRKSLGHSMNVIVLRLSINEAKTGKGSN